MRQLAHHSAAGHALTATAATPLILLHNPAGQNRPVGLKSLTDCLQAELVQPGKCGQSGQGKRK